VPDSPFVLTLLLTDGAREVEYVKEVVEISSLDVFFKEFSEPGWTTRRFLDSIQNTFVRGATAPRITVERPES
jgi:hypothetical protein